MAGSAEAKPVTWYVGIEGGLGGIMDEDARFVGTVPATITLTTASNVDVQFDSGWALLATLGMDVGGGWRMEGEVGYRTNDFTIHGAAFGGFTKTGSLDEITFMGNYLLDVSLNNSGSLKATFGFGFGLDYAQMKTGFGGLDATEWSFAYQGLAGLAYEIDDKTDLTLNFRHLRVAEPKFEDHVVIDSQVRFDALGKNSLSIGLRRDL